MIDLSKLPLFIQLFLIKYFSEFENKEKEIKYHKIIKNSYPKKLII